jgi:hypothetical protein
MVLEEDEFDKARILVVLHSWKRYHEMRHQFEESNNNALW